MYFQAAVKHILTYGDTFILGMFSTLSDQGLYGLASNYGGLIARMVFQPIEESSRNVFGKLLAATDGTTKPKPDSVKTSLAYLYDILRLYSLLSVLACALGPTIFPQVFRILIGSRWVSTNIDGVLSTYCYYIPVLAFNGISEAFVSSVASNSVLRSQSLMMTVFTLGFAGAAFIFLRVLHWGAEGLVWANIANMVLRTGWSIGFLLRYFRGMGEEFDFRRILPTAGTFATAAAAIAVLRALNPAVEGGFRGLVKSGSIALSTGCLM
jgi:oligosaccharide translocation protein RFT1